MKVSLASLVALLALLFVHSCNNEPPTKPDEPIALSLLANICNEQPLTLTPVPKPSKNQNLFLNF
jgi:hypothetical protein